MTTTPPGRFDPHLGLTRAELAPCRAVIFHGASGSGKSTYIDNLTETHSMFRHRARSYITGGPIDWTGAQQPLEPLVIVDELLTLHDFWQVVRLLRAGHWIIAASHLPPWLTASIGAAWPLRQFATDRDPVKIERFLSHRGVRFSRPIVAEYCNKYGATYTDIQIILDHVGGDDFDRAYTRFESLCRIDLVRPHRAWF